METLSLDAPFLSPIKKPDGLVMKMVFYFTKKQFGKVLTPLSVHSARLPLAFGNFYGKISKLDKKMVLNPELATLIRQKVASINVCSFCIDITRYFVSKESFKPDKLDALNDYKTSPLFTDTERAALDYATELTETKKVSPEIFSILRSFFSEREICEIAWLVASEHVYNLTNIGLNIHSDMLCDITKRK